MSGPTPTLPSTQLGVLSSKDSVTLKTFPVPTPGPNEVLIQNVAVASNPKDWKIPLWVEKYSYIEGNDVAGIIVKVGEGVSEYKGGERVAAFTKMATRDNKFGAYAQYSVALASNTFPIPESTSFEEASTLPLALMTAAIGLHKRLGIPEKAPSGEQKGIIINGASSSVGSYAVQLAKRAGFFVIGVAGSSKDYASSLGADVVVDYREHKGDALESALVKAAKGHSVQYVFDAVTTDSSTVLLARVLAKASPNGQGKVTFVLQLSEDENEQIPKGVDVERTSVGSAYGEDEEFAARFYRQVSSWLVPSSRNPTPFQPNRVKLIPDGLAGVAKGLELLKSGQVHGEKLVYRIADTPGISSESAKF